MKQGFLQRVGGASKGWVLWYVSRAVVLFVVLVCSKAYYYYYDHEF